MDFDVPTAGLAIVVDGVAREIVFDAMECTRRCYAHIAAGARSVLAFHVSYEFITPRDESDPIPDNVIPLFPPDVG